MMLGSLLVLVLVGGVLLYFWNERTHQNPRTLYPDSSTQTALDIARERYARGEITREEFDELRQALAQR